MNKKYEINYSLEELKQDILRQISLSKSESRRKALQGYLETLEMREKLLEQYRKSDEEDY